MNIADLHPRPYEPNADGIFAMPDPDYRKAPEVSQSMLKLLRRTPGHLLASLTLPPKKPTDAQIIGNLTDHALLEPEKFYNSFHVRPDDMKFTETDGKKWKADHLDKPIIYQRQYDSIRGMVDSVLRHDIASLIATRGFTQPNAFCHHRVTGLLRKGRLDKLLLDNDQRPVVADLKSCRNASERGFANAIAEFGYYIQNAYYSDIIQDLTGEAPTFLYIAVEKTPPYPCCVYQLDAEDIAEGRKQYESALETYARCKETGDWLNVGAQYSEGIKVVRMPRWAKEPDAPLIDNTTE